MLPPGGGLLPHLFTLTGDANRGKMSRRFSSGLSPGCFAGGIFLCGTVRDACRRRVLARARCTRPLGVTRRDALTLRPEGRRAPLARIRCPDFSSRPSPLARFQTSDHPAHPPTPIIQFHQSEHELEFASLTFGAAARGLQAHNVLDCLDKARKGIDGMISS